MTNLDELLTERLRLSATRPEDADELFPIFTDPAGWWYEPQSRHLDLDRTGAFTARAASRWSEGLSYWTVRRRADDVVVGLGGMQRHASGAWNLSYRIATSEQGRGLASELGRAAIAAAGEVDPDVAIIAWVYAHNTPSRRVAERLGLVDRGERIDANDGELRLAYSDRPLD